MQKFSQKRTFKYTGADLQAIKAYTGEEDPQKAVEAFIKKAIVDFKDPHDLLKELNSGQLD